MNDFFSILSLAPPLDHNGVYRLARHGCLDIHRVNWVRSYLSADGARLLCWFRAADAESVRLVLRHQGSPEASVWSAEATADPEDMPAHDNGERVIVFIDKTATGDPVIARLQGAGQEIRQVLRSPDDLKQVIVINGSDIDTARDSLQSTDPAPGHVWRCVEFDPKPSQLFEAPGQDTSPKKRSNGNGIRVDGDDIEYDAIIIGAGFSGIGMVKRLLEMGLRVRVYESAADVGGVWHWNRYPGARVDSETYTYAFSFSDDLLDEWQWQELFSPQPEIRRYIQHVTDRFDLRRHIQFNTRLVAARYDEQGSRWSIETDNGDQVTARYLIAATGTLSTPQLPDYPGMNEFAGDSFHTALWPDTEVELSGRRVGVIGTGASGVQVIQTIAQDVQQLTVFQRTPTYCVPQRNHALTDEERQEIRGNWAGILAACRKSYGGFIHCFDSRSGLAVSEKEREAVFEALWQTPGFAFWFGNFADLMMNMEVNDYASEFVRRKIRERVSDAEVARILQPNHPFGTKRVPLENGYYEVYNRDNVRLVDLQRSPIERITPEGIRTTREEHPLDIIVYATGFDAGTGALDRIDVRGNGGLELGRKWRDGPRTFLGLLISGFPNLFVVNGPQNAAGLCNAVQCIEQNVDWIARCIRHMRQRGLERIVPTATAEDKWTEHVCDVADGTVLGKMTDSWFFGANTPGKARRVNIYAGGAVEYRNHCEDVAKAGYQGCIFD